MSRPVLKFLIVAAAAFLCAASPAAAGFEDDVRSLSPAELAFAGFADRSVSPSIASTASASASSAEPSPRTPLRSALRSPLSKPKSVRWVDWQNTLIGDWVKGWDEFAAAQRLAKAQAGRLPQNEELRLEWEAMDKWLRKTAPVAHLGASITSRQAELFPESAEERANSRSARRELEKFTRASIRRLREARAAHASDTPNALTSDKTLRHLVFEILDRVYSYGQEMLAVAPDAEEAQAITNVRNALAPKLLRDGVVRYARDIASGKSPVDASNSALQRLNELGIALAWQDQAIATAQPSGQAIEVQPA